MMEDEKPFKCPRCSQCFATSDHLVVHQRVHTRDNRNLLVKMPASSSENVSDQTPTPTRFLKTADVDGGTVLFEDINPFDHDFKLASKRNSSPVPEHSASGISSTVTVTKTKSLLKNCENTSPISLESQLGETSRTNDEESEVSSSTMETPCNTIIKVGDQSTDGSSLHNHNQISSSTREEKFEVTESLNYTETEHNSSSGEFRNLQLNDNSNTYLVSDATASSSQQSHNTNSSTNEPSKNNSLQSLLQQIQKQTNAADSCTRTSSTQSQEALREQLKSLIKSGQIKIKFTSDPSSPKVQATIVGNIAKKTTVLPRTNGTPNFSQDQYKVDVQSQQKESGQNIVVQNENISHDKILISQPMQLDLEQKHPPPKIQLPQKLFQKHINSLQIKAKPKPIPIAPKEVSLSDPPISPVNISPKPVLCPSTVSSNTWSLPTSSSSLQFELTKEKLKHVIQQNVSNNGTENTFGNGQVSMISKITSQSKYKDIGFDSDDMMTSESENLKQCRKQKGRLIDDCSPEEKRQRFLERNRAAAARCRQKRKIWVTQLESKSDDLLQTNNILLNEINALRSEVAQLKALLLAHKDCPVTLQQKALLGQMTPGSYVAAVSDGQIIAIHQVPNGSTQASSAEEVATSALTDMAERATVELGAHLQISESREPISSCSSSS